MCFIATHYLQPDGENPMSLLYCELRESPVVEDSRLRIPCNGLQGDSLLCYSASVEPCCGADIKRVTVYKLLWIKRVCF